MITEAERTFLKEALRWSQMSYEEKAAKYLYGPQAVDGYREQYREKQAMFTALQTKLNKEKTR